MKVIETLSVILIGIPLLVIILTLFVAAVGLSLELGIKIVNFLLSI